MARTPRSSKLLAASRGDVEVDLLIRGGKIFSTATREWVETSLAIADGVIVGWGDRPAKEIIEVAGRHIVPAFIDAHMHLESTKLWIDEFVPLALANGTTTVIADPHEIANVFGVPGVSALIDAAKKQRFQFLVSASSCVPASKFESPGATLGPDSVASLLDDYGAIGVAEVMNYPGVIYGDDEVLAKIASANGRRVDGHAPSVRGKDLDAYLTAGVESDHECTTFEEAHEKRQKGMWIFIREGSASKNLRELIKTVKVGGTDRVALCTDDREPSTLIEDGHMNDCLKIAVECGIRPEDALVLATSNPAEYHQLYDLGSLGPGYQADVVVLEDLVSFKTNMVFHRGVQVAKDNIALPTAINLSPPPTWMLSSVNTEQKKHYDFFIDLDDSDIVRVIVVHENSLLTNERHTPATQLDNLSRIAVIERHHKTGRYGVGFVEGFGIERGAIASTVAHDAHNIMVVGGLNESSNNDMNIAIERLREIGGGQVAVLDGKILAEVRLNVGGLMSTLRAPEVAAQLRTLEEAVHSGLKGTLKEPFMTLSFLGLSVIPDLRITDLGLIDVVAFDKTTLKV